MAGWACRRGLGLAVAGLKVELVVVDGARIDAEVVVEGIVDVAEGSYSVDIDIVTCGEVGK